MCQSRETDRQTDLLCRAGVEHQDQAGGFAVEAEEALQEAVDAQSPGTDDQPVLVEEVQEDLVLVLQRNCRRHDGEQESPCFALRMSPGEGKGRRAGRGSAAFANQKWLRWGLGWAGVSLPSNPGDSSHWELQCKEAQGMQCNAIHLSVYY